MDPNQNMNVAGAAGAAPVQSAPSVPVANENIMAQGVSEKKKGGKGMLYGMILLAVLAIGGIGFGVWAYMDGDAQKNNLNEQIDSLKKQNNDLMDQLSDDVSVDIDTGSDADTADYIYVGEWGLKIRIPDGLNYVGYEFRQGEVLVGAEGSDVAVFGTVGDELSDFANIYKSDSSLGSVARILKGAYGDGLDCQYSSLVFSDNDYNYCYVHPQSVYSTSQEEQDLEVKTVDLIEQMLTNTENYLSI